MTSERGRSAPGPRAPRSDLVGSALSIVLGASVFEGPGQTPGDLPGQYFVARLRGRDVAGVGSVADESTRLGVEHLHLRR